MAKLLTREQILGSDDLLSKVVEVPEWGGSVKVLGMSGAKREQYDLSLHNEDGQVVDFKTKLVALSIVDKNNELLFSIKDVESLRAKSNSALNRVFTAADSLSRVTVAALEDDEKN